MDNNGIIIGYQLISEIEHGLRPEHIAVEHLPFRFYPTNTCLMDHSEGISNLPSGKLTICY